MIKLLMRSVTHKKFSIDSQVIFIPKKIYKEFSELYNEIITLSVLLGCRPSYENIVSRDCFVLLFKNKGIDVVFTLNKNVLTKILLYYTGDNYHINYNHEKEFLFSMNRLKDMILRSSI